jgi:hypothetical protein
MHPRRVRSRQAGAKFIMIAGTEDISLAAHHGQLEVWEENCPENFGNRAALVGEDRAY